MDGPKTRRREDFVQPSNCPTQAKIGLEWATRPVATSKVYTTPAPVSDDR